MDLDLDFLLMDLDLNRLIHASFEFGMRRVLPFNNFATVIYLLAILLRWSLDSVILTSFESRAGFLGEGTGSF